MFSIKQGISRAPSLSDCFTTCCHRHHLAKYNINDSPIHLATLIMQLCPKHSGQAADSNKAVVYAF